QLPTASPSGTVKMGKLFPGQAPRGEGTMRRFHWAIAGALMGALAGCSDTGTSEGPVPFKSGSTEQFNAMENQMQKTVQHQAYTKSSAGTAKPAEKSKSAGESKPAGESKSAGESKPAEKSKPDTKKE